MFSYQGLKSFLKALKYLKTSKEQPFETPGIWFALYGDCSFF